MSRELLQRSLELLETTEKWTHEMWMSLTHDIRAELEKEDCREECRKRFKMMEEKYIQLSRMDALRVENLAKKREAVLIEALEDLVSEFGECRATEKARGILGAWKKW